MRKAWVVAVWLSCLMAVVPQFQGCQSLDLQPAQTVDERLAYAMGIDTGVLKAIGQMSTSGELKGWEAKNLLNLSDNARALLDQAKYANDSGDINSAAARLDLATAVLERVQTYLHRGDTK